MASWSRVQGFAFRGFRAAELGPPLRSDIHAVAMIWEFPKVKGTVFLGPYNKDPTI